MPSIPASTQPLPDLQTSGDLIADRRYAYAFALLQEKEGEAAKDLFAQVLERVPHWPPALLGMGDACLLIQDEAQALVYFRLCLTHDPSDRLGAAPRLARLNAYNAADAISPAYVTALFDDYAKRFDTHLIDTLAYRAPDCLLQALLQERSSFDTTYDLGCGTGLMAALLRPYVRLLSGCDLSLAMLNEARLKNIYDRLDQDDCVHALQHMSPATLDLITAADVVVYMGDLTTLFDQVRQRLRPGGIFAFTAQACQGASFIIGDDLRSAHSENYLRQQAKQTDLICLRFESVSVRRDRDQPVAGWLCVFKSKE